MELMFRKKRYFVLQRTSVLSDRIEVELMKRNAIIKGEISAKKYNCFFIGTIVCLLFAGAILPRFTRVLNREYVIITEAPSAPNILYHQKVSTDISAIEVEITEKTAENRDKYELLLQLDNLTRISYDYKIQLNGYSSSLICDYSATEIEYGENYSAGERTKANTVYYFMSDKTVNEETVGTVRLSLIQNAPSPDTGIVELVMIAYFPGTDIRVSTVKQHLFFDII